MTFVVICFNHKRCQKKSVEDTFISIVVALTAIIRKPSNRYNSCFMCTPTLPVPGVQIGGWGVGGGQAGDSGKRCEHKKTTTRGWGRGESPLFLFIFFLDLFLRATLHYPNAWNRLTTTMWPAPQTELDL